MLTRKQHELLMFIHERDARDEEFRRLSMK